MNVTFKLHSRDGELPTFTTYRSSLPRKGEQLVWDNELYEVNMVRHFITVGETGPSNEALVIATRIT